MFDILPKRQFFQTAYPIVVIIAFILTWISLDPYRELAQAGHSDRQPSAEPGWVISQELSCHADSFDQNVEDSCHP